MLIKIVAPNFNAARHELESRFSSHGIDISRVGVVGRTNNRQEHLEMYGQVDVALDTVPRTGGSATAEALWMGAVATLVSDRFIGQLSASMLASAGLDELIAISEDDCVSIAKCLAENELRRSSLRSGMSERMNRSALGVGRALAHELDDVFRKMYSKQF